LGRESYAFTKKIAEGKRVRLEFDVERRDRYKRILAYVYLSDGTFLNAAIIEQGYASVMTYPPNVKYADLFRKLYTDARQNRRGLWR
jgi:micrococcal nuclease